MHAERKQIVTPGDLLAEGPYFAGENTYRDGSKIYSSRIGLADVIGNKLIVVPIKGAYIPRIDDIVIGRITDIGMSGWQVDIYAPYPAMLPASETPMQRGRDIGRRDLSHIYTVGDLVLAQVIAFDRTRDPLLTTKGRGLGKVTSGRVARITPAKIPRIHWEERFNDNNVEEGDWNGYHSRTKRRYPGYGKKPRRGKDSRRSSLHD